MLEDLDNFQFSESLEQWFRDHEFSRLPKQRTLTSNREKELADRITMLEGENRILKQESVEMLAWVRDIDKVSQRRYKAFRSLLSEFYKCSQQTEESTHEIGTRLFDLAGLLPPQTQIGREVKSLWMKVFAGCMKHNIFMRTLDPKGVNASEFNKLDDFEHPCQCGECFACKGDITQLLGLEKKDKKP